MKKQRIMLMSGYLGSGKTTSMTALAEYLNSVGKKACLITNDLGSNLVDTAYVNSHKIPVLEISNGCLCHDVDQLVEKIHIHMQKENPDIVIFEPVGSCVDMVEHVYKDMDRRFREDYVLAPVSAIVDPIRYREVYLEGKRGTDIGETAVAYGFCKQLEEADLLLLNKMDLLSREDSAEIMISLEKEFPGVPVIQISGLKRTNIDLWADYVLTHESSIRGLDIDMGLIMEGCEEMGWYNKVCTVETANAVDVHKFCEQYLSEIRKVFAEQNRQILHVKVNVEAKGKYLKAALTNTKGTIQMTGTLKEFCGEGVINVNIRALMLPKPLAELMEGTLERMLEKLDVHMKDNKLQSFLPVEEAPEPVETFESYRGGKG